MPDSSLHIKIPRFVQDVGMTILQGETTVHGCGKTGHFQRVCRNTIKEITLDTGDTTDIKFLGAIKTHRVSLGWLHY